MSENSKKAWHRLERLEREARSYNEFLRAWRVPQYGKADESLKQPPLDAHEHKKGT